MKKMLPSSDLLGSVASPDASDLTCPNSRFFLAGT